MKETHKKNYAGKKSNTTRKLRIKQYQNNGISNKHKEWCVFLTNYHNFCNKIYHFFFQKWPRVLVYMIKSALCEKLMPLFHPKLFTCVGHFVYYTTEYKIHKISCFIYDIYMRDLMYIRKKSEMRQWMMIWWRKIRKKCVKIWKISIIYTKIQKHPL